MAFTPTSYLQSEAAINAITEEASALIERREAALAELQDIFNGFSRMTDPEFGWLPAVSYINGEVASNPGDAAWADIKARLDKIVGDFVAERAKTGDILAAVTS